MKTYKVEFEITLMDDDMVNNTVFWEHIREQMSFYNLGLNPAMGESVYMMKVEEKLRG